MSIPISPDGIHYLRAAEGMDRKSTHRGLRVPAPYSRRWLLPLVLGPRPERWRALTLGSFAALPLVAGGYFHARGLAGRPLLFAVLLLCSLPGLRLPLRLPVLLDAPSFVLALATAWSASAGPWWATLVLALISGATRETAPVFAALWAWSPWPLVGLAAVGWWRPSAPADEASEPWLVHPLREVWALRMRLGLDGSLYLRPWGAALAGFVAPSWQTLATVAVAYAQLLVAVDTLRLAVWAAPVLVFGAAQTIPVAWWPLAVAATLLHIDDRA